MHRVPSLKGNQRVSPELMTYEERFLMMPSTDTIERPQEALRVARRYLRRERLVNALVVTLVVSLFLGTYVIMSLIPAVVVGAVLIVVARAPILQSTGTVQLRTDDGPETVLDALTGPTPPVLALQWESLTKSPERMVCQYTRPRICSDCALSNRLSTLRRQLPHTGSTKSKSNIFDSLFF